MVDLVCCEKKLTKDEFKEFEQLFHQKIPEAFKLYYMNNNGGFPAEEDVEAGRWGLPVNGFNPIKYGRLPIDKLIFDLGDIVASDAELGIWEKLWFIPFAYDSGGNTIFISLRENDYGQIYIYAQDGNNIFNIMPSFEAFIQKLYKNENP